MVTESDGAHELAAFDQFAALCVSLCVVVAVLMLGMPFYSTNMAAISAVVMLAALLITLGLRVRVLVNRRTMKVQHRWLWLSYRSIEFDISSATASIVGAGDWGDSGGWPIAELCAVSGRIGDSSARTFVGTVRARHEIAQFLNQSIATWITADPNTQGAMGC